MNPITRRLIKSRTPISGVDVAPKVAYLSGSTYTLQMQCGIDVPMPDGEGVNIVLRVDTLKALSAELGLIFSSHMPQSGSFAKSAIMGRNDPPNYVANTGEWEKR